MIDLGKTARSFRYAMRGWATLARTENNARFHLVATAAVVAAGFFFGLSPVEWSVIGTQIALVWAAEGFNTAFERLVDLVSPDYEARAGTVKDLAAGAVLMVCVSAAVSGLVIFVPKIILRFGS